MKLTIHILALLLIGLNCFSQVPQNFAYQAVVRNTQGQVLANQNAEIRVSLIEGTIAGAASYSETHVVTTSPQGIVNLIIGDGVAKFKSINAVTWNQPTFIKLEIKLSGTPSFVDMGTSQLLSVPYALKAGSLAKNPIEILAPADQNPEEPIFVVKNSQDQVVFAVYETGTRVYVDKSTAKGSRGGFAVGGIGDNLKEGTVPHYLTIEPDSVRFNINQTTKGNRGGFAVGGIGDNLKGLQDYLYIRPDSIRFAVDESFNEKGNRGGFAIGGIGDNNKTFNNYFYVNQDCTFVANTLNAVGNVIVTGNMLMGGTIGTIPITDGEGNSYATVSLGGNIWMAENLRTTKYNDGTDLTSPIFENGPSYFQVHNELDEPLDVNFWGYLYALKVIDPNRICPTGWKLPTAQDWNNLIMATNAMGNAITLVDNINEYWTGGIKNKTEKVQGGFNARPTGYLYIEPIPFPIYSSFGNTTSFWTMPYPDEQAGGMITSQVFNLTQWSYDYFGINNNPEQLDPGVQLFNGYSIRCIKGETPVIP